MHNRAGLNNCTLTNITACKNNNPSTYPYIIVDYCFYFGFIEPDNTNEEKTKLINKIMSLDSMTLNIYKTSLESAEQIVKIIKSKQET